MSKQKMCVYSYDDDRVRFLMRYTFVTAFFSGVIVAMIIDRLLS